VPQIQDIWIEEPLRRLPWKVICSDADSVFRLVRGYVPRIEVCLQLDDKLHGPKMTPDTENNPPPGHLCSSEK